LEEIVDVIKSQPGRFVKQDKKSGEWLSVSRSDATTKTARAMQYQARHVKAATAATENAFGACAREQSVVHSQSVITFKHENKQMLSQLAEYSPFSAPQDTVLSSLGGVSHLHPHGARAPLWDSGTTPLEHYLQYRAWLTMNHSVPNEPAVCRRVSELREPEWPPPRWMQRRPELYIPLLHHRYQLSSLHDHHYSQKYHANATSVTQIPASNAPLATSPSSPNKSHQLVLPVHDLSEMADDSVGSDDWCATSLGSFNSEDELEHLDRHMKW
jgi:hypothetical protein